MWDRRIHWLTRGDTKSSSTGWDAWNIAAMTRPGSRSFDGHALHLRRSVGKLASLAAQLREQPADGSCGIGHTRWATHGGPTELQRPPAPRRDGDSP